MTIIELRQHILNRLGSPVINIELASEQMDIHINDTVEKFIETHYDGLDEGYIFLDVTVGTSEYTLPSTVHSVLEIVSTTGYPSATGEPLLVNPYLVGNTYAFGGLGVSGSVLDVELYNQTMAMYENRMEMKILFEYNSTTDLIKILAPPKEDIRYALRVHASPVDTETIYNNTWVQKYATTLCKIQWGENVGKFEGATLPGGVSLNYQRIIDEGKENKEKLEEELYEL